MAVLLLAEVNNGELAMDATAKAVTAAQSLGDVTVLAAGASAAAAGDAAAKIDGVARVLVAEDAALGHRLAESTAATIVALAGDYEHIVAPATTDAKNVMPRVAALLDAMVISDVSGVVDANTFERPIYAGNAIQTVKSSDAKKVVTFRTSTFDAAGEGGSASVETVSAAADPGLSSWVEDKVAESDRPELTSAGVVVSGGRGVGSEEDFALIEHLGDELTPFNRNEDGFNDVGVFAGRHQHVTAGSNQQHGYKSHQNEGKSRSSSGTQLSIFHGFLLF